VGQALPPDSTWGGSTKIRRIAMLTRRESRLTIAVYLIILGFCVVYSLFAARNVINTMRSARDHFAAAECNRKIYAIGGMDTADSYLDEIMEIDPDTGRGKVIGHLPSPRADLAAVEVGGKIYAIGGYDGQNFTDQIVEIDPSTKDVMVIGYLPSARAFLGAVKAGSKIWAIGGWDGKHYLDDVLVMDPANGEANVVAHLP